MDEKIKKAVLAVQRTEETEHLIYLQLADSCRDEKMPKYCAKSDFRKKVMPFFGKKFRKLKCNPTCSEYSELCCWPNYSDSLLC